MPKDIINFAYILQEVLLNRRQICYLRNPVDFSLVVAMLY